jgi:hypothetical protein
MNSMVLPVLLAVLAGCSQSKPTQDERAATARARLAPFHGEVVLPSARHARPWKPPEAGSVPVVEVLRDGTWIVDGTPVRQETADALVTLRKLLYEQARRMPQAAPIEGWKGPKVPANALFLRTDRDAPWSAVRPVIASCAMQGIHIFDLDVQVASDEQQPKVLRLALPRVIGGFHHLGEPLMHSLILEAGTALRTYDGTESTLPVDLELRGLQYGFEEAQRADSRFDDVQAFVERLREIAGSVSTVEILLPESAPAWIGVLAVDLAVEARLTYVEVPVLSLDELEKL